MLLSKPIQKVQNRVCFEILLNEFDINHFKEKVCQGFEFQVLTNSPQFLLLFISNFKIHFSLVMRYKGLKY